MVTAGLHRLRWWNHSERRQRLGGRGPREPRRRGVQLGRQQWAASMLRAATAASVAIRHAAPRAPGPRPRDAAARRPVRSRERLDAATMISTSLRNSRQPCHASGGCPGVAQRIALQWSFDNGIHRRPQRVDSGLGPDRGHCRRRPRTTPRYQLTPSTWLNDRPAPAAPPGPARPVGRELAERVGSVAAYRSARHSCASPGSTAGVGAQPHGCRRTSPRRTVSSGSPAALR
jgi:hypothetical protein